MKGKFRQAMVSLAVFAVIIIALVSIDDRVQERFTLLFANGQGLSPWGDRASDLGGALISAVRHQSIENAPLLVFAAGGAVLFLFMVKT
jgi:hypothetical protein